MKILLVDDDPTLRRLIEYELLQEGHTVIAVEDGLHAWEVILQEPIEMLITDWLMPEINGLDLCRLVRSMDPGMYIYTILISSLSDQDDVLAAFDAGVDDFVAKPIHFPLMHARIRAGERIVKLEQELAQRSAVLLETNIELQETRGMMRRDLEAGAELQHSLLPVPGYRTSGYAAGWLYRPHSIVAGDMLNLFERGENALIFYLLDVVGHGIRSALLTVSITKMLTMPDTAASKQGDGPGDPRSPEEVLQMLNNRFQSIDTSQYFTMVYGTLETTTGRVRLGQAGHPPPILLGPDGHRLIGEGGLPIGWIADAEFEVYEFTLPRGSRLILYSDGVSECENPAGDLFSVERLAQHFAEHRSSPLQESVRALERSLTTWSAGAEFNDDVSLLAIERL